MCYRKKLKLENKKSKFFLYFSIFQHTSHQATFVADFGRSVNHIKPLMSRCPPNQSLLNFTLGGGAIARQHAPPTLGHQCCSFYCLPSHPYTHMDRPFGLQEVHATRNSRKLAHEDCKAVSPMQWLPLYPSGESPDTSVHWMVNWPHGQRRIVNEKICTCAHTHTHTHPQNTSGCEYSKEEKLI
jgi:hypothetical protein